MAESDPLDIHVLDSLDCWCVPRYFIPCDECGHTESWDRITAGVDRVHARPKDLSTLEGCWKCKNQLLELTREAAEASKETILVVHNEPN